MIYNKNEGNLSVTWQHFWELSLLYTFLIGLSGKQFWSVDEYKRTIYIPDSHNITQTQIHKGVISLLTLSESRKDNLRRNLNRIAAIRKKSGEAIIGAKLRYDCGCMCGGAACLTDEELTNIPVNSNTGIKNISKYNISLSYDDMTTMRMLEDVHDLYMISCYEDELFDKFIEVVNEILEEDVSICL